MILVGILYEWYSRVGRVGRKADGKTHGTVLDFVDDVGMYLGWSRKRDGYYKKINAEYEWCIILALYILTPIYLLFYIILFYIIKNVPLYNICIKK